MYNRKQILEIYNKISDDKLDNSELLTILPKLYLIINKVNVDEVELIRTVDVLKEINKYNKLDNVTPEVIDLIIRSIKNGDIDLEGAVYFSIMLKHVILPYNENFCDEEYNTVLFLSEFEIFIELFNKMLKKKDLIILDKYNHELKEVIVKYKEVMNIYKRCVINDVMFGAMISHFAAMLYFNLDDYDFDYDLISDLSYDLINNYQKFIDYCFNLGIHKNFTRIQEDLKGIEYEYAVSNEMLKYTYNNKKEEKIKRKC